ncbi:hypothetical protein GCM10020367_38520 [Streptomyces sannanensis]|uniref:Transporter n=1 Tax=Streptomyces sannanensis TaxID=285536 RepID=A0ABP6SE04_9ACTN
MARRNPLPPPPPPVHLRAWPDREAMLADRAQVLGELSRRSVGLRRLMLLWAMAVLVAVGWSFVGAALLTFAESLDVISYFFGALMLALGLASMVPTGFAVAGAVRRDRQVRELLDQWGALDRDPAADARCRAPGPTLCWLLLSVAPCALGLYVSFASTAGAEPGRDTYAGVAYGLGMGVIAWLTGLLGVAKAVSHYRWVTRTLMGAPVRR